MKSLMLLFRSILIEYGDMFNTSTTRDLKTVESRFENEGLSFLTISLPNFGKDFEKSLDQGYVDRSLFQGFSWRAGLPQLFGGFLDLIFDRTSGVLLDAPDIDSIRAVRQLTLQFGKIEIECSPERKDAAVQKYIECEREVRISDKSFDSLKEPFERIGGLLWNDIFSRMDQSIHDLSLIPKHGPGATADKLVGNNKFLVKSWPSRLEEEFPISEYAFHSYAAYLSALPALNFLEPGQELPVKVTLVPKTLKTPRIICVEPTAMQYMQQALMRNFEENLALDDISAGLIDYSSQVPNQELAKSGSLTGALATLDLSEASDRVSNQHVRSLMRNFPHLLRGVDACRSRKAVDPSGTVHRLAKFASMGSALCFPMEAVVFCTLVFVGIERKLNTRLTKKDIKSFLGKVRIYGDDIIVPVDFVDSVISTLEDFGLKVNAGKSFWTGKFRESCGKDYYDGIDISIVRLRQVLPSSRKHSSEIAATVSFRNELYKRGLWNTVKHLDSIIERVIPFPRTAETSPALGRFSFLGFDQERMHPSLQRPLVRAAVLKAKPRPSNILDEGDAALQKWFLKTGELPFADVNHLSYAGRPLSVDIKIGWTHSY